MASDPSPSPADELLTWAERRFPNLSEAEKKLLRIAPKGDMALYGPSIIGRDVKEDPEFDPSKADAWGQERFIRAELVRWLCADPAAKTRVDPKGIEIYFAKIGGLLNLSSVTVPFPLTFWGCRLNVAFFNGVEIPSLYLNASWVGEIIADGARVKGSVLLRNGFHAEGEVRLVGAQIGGNLECDGSTFKNPAWEKFDGGGTALQASGIIVTGNVFLRDGFRAEGAVWLQGAQIGGSLQCNGGVFKNPPIGTNKNSGTALYADNISVTGDVFLRDGFSAEGVVRLQGAQIGGDLNCRGGKFSKLNIRSAAIKGSFFWIDEHDPKRATLVLSNATVGSIVDDEPSWPDPGNLYIDGFVYGRISAGPTEPHRRLEWVELQPEFRPQPYRQLARVLSESGDDDGARYVLYRMEDRRQKEDRSYFLKWFLRVTVGHGYYPLRSLWGLGLLSGVGWLIYRRAHLARAMAPTEEHAYRHFRTNGLPPPHYKRFFPFFFSLENSLPLVQLGLAERWQPDSDPPPPSPMIRPGKWTKRLFRLIKSRELRKPYMRTRGFARRLWRPFGSERFLRTFLWVQIILGWVLATLFAAGVSGILRRD